MSLVILLASLRPSAEVKGLTRNLLQPSGASDPVTYSGEGVVSLVVAGFRVVCIPQIVPFRLYNFYVQLFPWICFSAARLVAI